ncbi:hypothetical protein PSHT_06328, partial [Puccinia striiformis]
RVFVSPFILEARFSCLLLFGLFRWLTLRESLGNLSEDVDVSTRTTEPSSSSIKRLPATTQDGIHTRNYFHVSANPSIPTPLAARLQRNSQKWRSNPSALEMCSWQPLRTSRPTQPQVKQLHSPSKIELSDGDKLLTDLARFMSLWTSDLICQWIPDTKADLATTTHLPSEKTTVAAQQPQRPMREEVTKKDVAGKVRTDGKLVVSEFKEPLRHS